MKKHVCKIDKNGTLFVPMHKLVDVVYRVIVDAEYRGTYFKKEAAIRRLHRVLRTEYNDYRGGDYESLGCIEILTLNSDACKIIEIEDVISRKWEIKQ